VPIYPPVTKVETIDDIREHITYANYKETNPLSTDQNMLINNKVDEEREKIVKAIELEYNFYNLFRNTLKIVFNYKSSLDTKRDIMKIVENVVITYIEKMERIILKLHKLLDNAVNFDREFQLDSLEDYDDMITCLGLGPEECGKGNTEKYCKLKEQATFMQKHTCVLTLPKTNLYSKKSNEVIYFNKLTDEIIRYSKIRNYLFTPSEFLSFGHVNYRINDDEIVLLEGILLVDNYLNDIILKQENKYISSRNIYDITSPARSNDLVLYSSNVRNGYFKKGEEEGRYETDEETDGKTDEEIDVENEEDVLEPGCVDEERYTANLSLSNDNTPFSVDQYKSTGSCCFNCIKFIIDTHTTETSITDIKQVLIDEY